MFDVASSRDAPYRERIEELIRASIADFGPKSPLRDACEYALTNGGRRFRPALVMMVADALGNHCDVSQAALGIEYFHTASLIADDLPCMDNGEVRRGGLTLHRAYGESVALLASYALIAAGYACIAKNPLPLETDRDLLSRLILESATSNTGICGATGGQFLDLFPAQTSMEAVREVIHKKTIALFEISFVYGWLFGGGAVGSLPAVKRCAAHFGMAFQIADDLQDCAEDAKGDASVNWATLFGRESAVKAFREEIAACKKAFSALSLLSEPFIALIQLLEQQVEHPS